MKRILKHILLLMSIMSAISVACLAKDTYTQISQEEASMGYTNIYEFGGILDWTGDIVSDEMKGGIQLSVDGTQAPVTWEENVSVDELKTLLPLTVKMSMYGGFEQVGPVGRSIVSNDEQITTEAGDIILYAGDRIVIFYGSNSWAYTKLGHIDQAQEEIEKLLGQEDVEIQLGWEE